MQEPFEGAVRAHGRTVLAVCRSLLRDDGAQDAWSETFLSALVAWPALPEDANVEAWLVTIARRKALDELRRRGRHAVPTDLHDGDVHVAARGHASGSVEVPGDRDLDLWAALTGLSERQRQVVVLHHVGGMPYADVAQVVGGSVVAARRAGADGVAALRRTLAARGRPVPHERTRTHPRSWTHDESTEVDGA